jgi:hypothetical protein
VELRGSTPFRCVPSSVRSVESAAVALRADVTAILAGSTMPRFPREVIPTPSRPRESGAHLFRASSGPLRVGPDLQAVRVAADVRAGHPSFTRRTAGVRFLAMATLESVRTLLATFYAYHDKDFGEVVFDRILIVGDRVLLTGQRGADRFTSVFSVDDEGVRRVQDYASVDAALDALKRPRT